jgi:hypothetical protein
MRGSNTRTQGIHPHPFALPLTSNPSKRGEGCQRSWRREGFPGEFLPLWRYLSLELLLFVPPLTR